MVGHRSSIIGPVLYGLAWAVVAPAILLWWALAADRVVTLPPVHSPVVGGLLAVIGISFMALGMAALAIHGRGLPMNAYPPPRYVAQAIYGWIPHPIYVGFIILATGLAIAFGSASGLWLVTPAAALVLVALVLGYEAPDLSRRFGEAVRPPRLSLPRAGDGQPGPWERVSVYLLVFLPWLLLSQAVQLFGGGPGLSQAAWWGAAALVLLTPLVIRSRPVLRRMAVTGLMGAGLVGFIHLVAPLSPGSAAALHLLLPLICAEAWWSLGRVWGAAPSVWVGLMALKFVAADVDSPFGVLLALALFLVLSRYDGVWRGLRLATEWLANSWREWRIGPVRIINHGFYTGLGGALGAWIAGRLAGPELVLPLLLVAGASLLGAVLWAQFVEGSPMLLRPLGWYGGLIGGLLALGALALLGVPVMPLLGALAVALPWVQAVGRLRCLVQGCCHGGPAAPALGIRYFHSRSRVTQIAGLTGVPLHATPLYSILTNVVIGALLHRLWVAGASMGLAIGLYFILSAVARFVEEAYRGEPQTPVVAGLRLYQWLALASFAIGILFTVQQVTPPPAPLSATDPGLLAGALLVGLVGWFVTGVDFPGSNRRFSRLADADQPPRLLKG